MPKDPRAIIEEDREKIDELMAQAREAPAIEDPKVVNERHQEIERLDKEVLHAENLASLDENDSYSDEPKSVLTDPEWDPSAGAPGDPGSRQPRPPTGED